MQDAGSVTKTTMSDQFDSDMLSQINHEDTLVTSMTGPQLVKRRDLSRSVAQHDMASMQFHVAIKTMYLCRTEH